MISQKWNRKEEITSTGKYRNCWIKWYKNTQVAQISETFLFFSTKYITGEPEPEWHRVCLVFTWLPLQCVWLSIKKCFPPAYAKIQWQSHFLCITLFLAPHRGLFYERFECLWWKCFFNGVHWREMLFVFLVHFIK